MDACAWPDCRGFFLVAGTGASDCFETEAIVLDGYTRFAGSFRRFLLGVACLARAIFASLLILYASRMLAPEYGLARAASIAVLLYTVHNVFSAGSAYASGWLSDHIPQRKLVLAGGYALAGITAIRFIPGRIRCGCSV